MAVGGPFSLEGAVALVTGAGGGIGAAICKALAGAGARVACAELPDRLDRARAVCDAALASATEWAREADAFTVPLDVRSRPSIHEAIERVIERWGRLDVLVNNAGVNRLKPALDLVEKDWDDVLDVNLRGAFFCAQAAARIMVRGGGGRIIQIASQHGVVGMPYRAAYCASKAGLINLTRVLALEWASAGITVNCVSPTFVRTEANDRVLDDPAFLTWVRDRLPLGRLATPEDVAGAVLYLASPAAAMVTGHNLVVDGGWTAW